MKDEEYKVSPWDEFKRVIRDVFPVTEKKDIVDQIISNLEKKVKDGDALKREGQCSLSSFRKIITGELETYQLRMHCEAVFAALLEARQRTESKSPDVTGEHPTGSKSSPSSQ